MQSRSAFLPTSAEDLKARRWQTCDFIVISGDAYVDHPSFGSALVARLLEAEGYRVGFIAQPDWKSPKDVTRLGKPRLAFLVASGNIDSMVNHYTANRKPRSEDAFSPGGVTGKRPDRALVAYCNCLRAAFPGCPVIAGGLEASLRRLTHYDYWSDTLKKPIILDSKADLVVYGMAERALTEIAARLAKGENIKEIRDVRGTVWRTGREAEVPADALSLPSHDDQVADKKTFAEAFMIQYRNTDPINGLRLVERDKAGWVVQNPPALPLESGYLDRISELPFTRRSHPDYDAVGGVPAIKEVQFSLASVRGCFGSCSFCALAFHQGRHIQSRSRESLLREAKILSSMKEFKGIIHDVGGPTANFRRNPCAKMSTHGACKERRCLAPEPCPNVKATHSEYRGILRELRALPSVKKVYIRSGIRFDYLMLDPDRGFLEDLCAHHVSGQLKVAPEHVSPRVLAAMGKPGAERYRAFARAFDETNRKLGKEQFLIPYYISAHPGSSLEDALELALELRRSGFVPDQVQDYYPTPGTLSAAMYYCGFDPETGKDMHVARGERERKLQRALLHFHKPENRELVREALKGLGRTDLIGTGADCLVAR